MRIRLAEALDANLPHVMTFHALAYALVHPEETFLYDDLSADQLGRSYEVQEIIDEHIRSPEYRGRIRDLMLAHFREDWERIEGGQFQLTMDEFLAYRRALPRESMKGDYVKSFGERFIANTLFEYGIEYRYERNFRWDDSNYRPDFTIPIGAKGGVVIEYFGLEGDTDYDDMSQQKRLFWAEHPEWQFLEFSPNDLLRNGTDGFVRTLLGILSKRRIPCRKRSEEEIWELIKRRAVDGFTTAMKNFIGRCRKSNLTPESLELMVAKHTCCSTAETLFLEIAVSVYRGYLQRLAEHQREDFDGLVWRSVSSIRNGQTQFVRDKSKERGDIAQLRFVMIDEFQDFSPMFFELVTAIRTINPNVRFFCVGDDWQAINGFAGSDLCFFDGFGTYFPGASRCFLRTNYRSPRSVVEVGNALMHGSGPAAKPERNDSGVVWLCNLDEFKPSAQEMVRHNGDEVTPAILRIVSHLLNRGLDVVMLSRRHNLPWYVNYDKVAAKIANPLERFQEHIRSYLPEEDCERVTVSTVHQYKGLEQSAVIILDAVKRSYPLLHPHWVFLRVFGNNLAQIEAEERRLFYVAATRSQNALAFVTEARVESAFLDDIRRHVALPTFVWTDLSPMPSLDDTHLEIRVFNAYHVRDQLKRMNYQWNSVDKYWHRAVRAEGFTLATLLRQPWVKAGVTIEIYDELGNLIHTGIA